MKRLFLSALLALAFIAADPAVSASFTVHCDDQDPPVPEGTCAIKLSGLIEPGDAQRLLRIVRKPQQAGGSYRTLVLDSPGGSVVAAIELAAAVRQALLFTSTGLVNATSLVYYRCVSACFLVWVAGSQRLTTAFLVPRNADGTSQIGLHRPYLDRKSYERPPTEVAAMQQHVMRLTAEYLKREQVPQSLIEKMLSRASTDVYWVGPEDTNISGMSPWFEEMMIVRCGYNPARVREDASYAADRTIERLLETGSADKAFQGRDQRELEAKARSDRYENCRHSNQVAAQRGLAK